jgi:hypothetical protein
MRRTFITTSDLLNMPGQLLVTVYNDGATIAYRPNPSAAWGPPMLTRETESSKK